MASPLFDSKNRPKSPEQLIKENWVKLGNPAILSRESVPGVFLYAALCVDKSLPPMLQVPTKLAKVFFVPLEKQEPVANGTQTVVLIPDRVNPWIQSALTKMGCAVVLGMPSRFDRILF